MTYSTLAALAVNPTIFLLSQLGIQLSFFYRPKYSFLFVSR